MVEPEIVYGDWFAGLVGRNNVGATLVISPLKVLNLSIPFKVSLIVKTNSVNLESKPT